MKNSEKVNQILSWYQHENNNVQKNIERLLNSGYLGGTGKLVILPVDQGFEHGHQNHLRQIQTHMILIITLILPLRQGAMHMLHLWVF